MRKKILDVEKLSVESFDTTSETQETSNEFQCTGCDSTCGIVWP